MIIMIYGYRSLFEQLVVAMHLSILIRPECVSDCLFVRGKFPGSLIKKTVRVTGLVFSVKCRYNPDETKW